MLLLLSCTAPTDSAGVDDSAVVEESASPDDSADSQDTGEPSCGVVTFSSASGEVDYSSAFTLGEPVTLSEDGTLSFCAGTWFVLLTVEATVEVLGLGSEPARTVLSGGESGTVLVVEGADLSVENVTVDRGLAREEGNAGSGAGLRCLEGGTVRVRDAIFSNHSAYDGAGMYGRDGCSLEVEDTVFRDNEVTDDGGALRVQKSSAVLRNVTFEDNEARDAGAVILQESDVVIEGATFRGNHVRDTQGGAILHYWGTLSITDSVFEGNDANGRGGALSLFGDTTVRSTSFSDNHTDYGGAIYVYTTDGTLTCEDCSFSGNEPDDVATDLGGSYDYDEASFVCDESGCTP
ncbi:MAG TPA: right-handed parallel beta-helix repeat-containing protein [Myxococcota bacterium]|nr:right-handed parallel beta-helix repeat-containing protein [Myxococcota bacterium]